MTLGSGADTLVLKISETAYQGDAQFTVSVNGKQVGGILTAKALHGLASDTLTLKGDWNVGAHKVNVTFLNDHWGGSAATDRNLYVDGISFNGKAVSGGTATLKTNGTTNFAFSKPAAPVPEKGDVTVGSGSDTLVLKVSETAYQGDAQFTVKVDGKQIGGVFTAKTLHGAGSDTITLKGDWGAGAHKVSVSFINDHWGGSAATDRNLYVDSISFNGKAVAGGSADLLSNGTADFAFTKTATNMPGKGDASAGSGANTLVLKVSETAYQGDAQFTVKVDGKQIGGVFTAKTLHGAGSDTITLKGNWSAGTHKVDVSFINDHWGGTAATDRNLYVDSISFNGKAVSGGTATLKTNGTSSFSFTSAGGGSELGGVPGNWREVWHETFDNGKGMFSRSWGPGVDTSVKGQLTIHTSADDRDSGAMVPPTSAKAGYGYGLYEYVLKMQGTIGVYALAWPSSDNWPGPELDLVEILPDGRPYSTIHWKGSDGRDQYKSYFLDGVDETQVHTYSLLWEEGRLTAYVDGVQKWTTTDRVPKDYAHGGENVAPGIGVQTHWNGGSLGGNNWITIYDASYSVIT
jgi:hypothetical protein